MQEQFKGKISNFEKFLILITVKRNFIYERRRLKPKILILILSIRDNLAMI